jgi:hypothetical protein
VSIEVSEGGWDAPNREETEASLDSEGSTQACRNWCHLSRRDPLTFTMFMSDMKL